MQACVPPSSTHFHHQPASKCTASFCVAVSTTVLTANDHKLKQGHCTYLTVFSRHQENKKTMLAQEVCLSLPLIPLGVWLFTGLIWWTWLPLRTDRGCCGTMTEIKRISIIFTELSKLCQGQLFRAITPTCPSGSRLHKKASVNNGTDKSAD